MTRPGSQEPLGLTQLYFSAGVGFPYVLRVFAQEIVPRPDSGSAFVCKSHVRLCVASPVVRDNHSAVKTLVKQMTPCPAAEA